MHLCIYVGEYVRLEQAGSGVFGVSPGRLAGVISWLASWLAGGLAGLLRPERLREAQRGLERNKEAERG